MAGQGGKRSADEVAVYLGEGLARYNFGETHPFGPRRLQAFEAAFRARGLERRCRIRAPVQGSEEAILRFHTPGYVARVQRASVSGAGYLDSGDTPAFPGVYEAAATVVGSVLDGLQGVMDGAWTRAFVPIAGLHHARRDSAAGFCVFNDCGVAIETLFGVYGLNRVAYVDIDSHHGDGVFYAFEDDPRLIFADIHQDGRTLYPGTGFADETGRGPAVGTKLNIPVPPGADDAVFMAAWGRVEDFVARYSPQLVLLQCGVDSLAGDPITELRYSAAAHAHAAHRLRALTERVCGGRLLALGGGGYALENIAAGWTAVVQALCPGPVAPNTI